MSESAASFVPISDSTATVALGLMSAAIWGTSDFVGGFAARRLAASAVVTLSHTLSLILLILLAVTLRSPFPDHRSALFGLLGGLACGTGVIALYKGLALGGMGLTAAVSGVIAAVLPVVWGFVSEGLPSTVQVAGIVMAAAAIWMIACAPDATYSKEGIWLGAVAGASFGALFILLKLAGRGGVLWPLACSRLVSGSVALLTWFTSVRRGGNSGGECGGERGGVVRLGGGQTAWWPGWPVLGLIAVAGVFDVAGNSFYTLATRMGRLDIAAVLSSLYPASTMLLAAVVLRERTTRSQTAGMALAMIAVVLISA
jgi:drug/metabolite transporter (DMT)-like permease